MKNLIIKLFSFNDFSNFMYDYKNYIGWRLKMNNDFLFNGFRYFGSYPLQYGFEKEKILVAFKGQKELPEDIIGLIWFGDYGPEMQQAISFIDVRTDYQHQGVATALIKELDNHLDKNKPLCLSSLSNDGLRCHIDEVFKRYITTDVVVKFY